MITEKQINQLNAKLNPQYVAKRQQGSVKVSYIEAHHAIREANRIFGFDAWTRETNSLNLVQAEQKPAKNGGGDNWYVSYIAQVTVTALNATRQGTGFGQGIDRDLGQAHESAAKEAESDAMKRAMMTFGDQFGLALYDKKQENVGVDAPQPIPQSVSGSEKERNAGLYFRRTLNGTREQLLELKSLAGEEWAQVCLDAEQKGIATFIGLMKFANGEDGDPKESTDQTTQDTPQSNERLGADHGPEVTEENAKLFMKSLKCDATGVKLFKSHCEAVGRDWIATAVAAKIAGVDSPQHLLVFAKSGVAI